MLYIEAILPLTIALLPPGETQLPLGGLVRFEPDWLDRSEADRLFDWLRTEVAWTQGSIQFFGRARLEPRLSAWFGDEDYTYSGRTLRAAPWPLELTALRTRVERAAGASFNAVLLNRYRSGDDSMGMHSDDEPELGPNPTLASVSVGAARRFALQPKKKSERQGGSVELVLEHGSLLVMAGACQHRYRHGVPKELGRDGERMNLTFRRVSFWDKGA
ncbi:MAG TPA: alpha-ketoglutarate-dependent dioxygenase AlkB [Polyangiaceae bacterium]|nr:alpha-ketoglutarate-dependent dioxygenase AlkB [Polyangiaceae bacterium]